VTEGNAENQGRSMPQCYYRKTGNAAGTEPITIKEVFPFCKEGEE